MNPLLEAHNVCKSFPGVRALDGVGLKVFAGEVLAVVGENGAGKSTLMKILGGVQNADAGTIQWEGQPIRLRSVQDAERLGIVLIHQELNLAPDLDVAGNVFLGREPSRWGLLVRSIYPQTRAITDRLGLEISPHTLVGNLTPGQQQLVEIARALSLKSRLLILDEPTSSLTERESSMLFEVLRNLRKDGLGIVYISHRLKEVVDIADRVTVLRDGRNAGELSRAEISHDAIVRLMVGRELKQFFHRGAGGSPGEAGGQSLHRGTGGSPVEAGEPPAPRAEITLEVRNLRWSSAQRDGISFCLRPGEIVGMAGLIGAGRTELAETLFGMRRRVSGEVRLRGKLLSVRRPAQAIAAGIFLIPEDRRHEGLILSDDIKDNICLPNLDLVSFASLVRRRPERQLAEKMSARLGVRASSIDQTTGLLSGGNQQKVVLAKWLCRVPSVLILDEPTRGVDVGAKSEIYALMDEFARQGLAVLMISSDLEEILGMSDRVLVLHQGRLAGELARQQLSEEAIMHLATGGNS
jgi:ribose transport system ATP-binding protein